MANELVVGKLRAILGLDTAQYEAGARKAAAVNKQMTAEMRRTRDSISALAGPLRATAAAFGVAFSAAAVVNFAREINRFAGEMVNLSAETGITTKRLQALNFVAADADLTVGDLTGAVIQLQRRLAGGDESAEAAVERLGFAVGDVLAMRPDEMFIELGQAIAKIEDPAIRAALRFDLMGRTGTQAARIMTTELGKLVEEAEKSGAIIDDALIRRADDFDKAWQQGILHVKAAIANLFGDVFKLSNLLPAMITGDFAALKAEKGDIPLSDRPGRDLSIVHGLGLPEKNKADEQALAAHEKRNQEIIRESSERAAEIERARIATVDAMRQMESDAFADLQRRNAEAIERAGEAAQEVEIARRADIEARTRMESDAHAAYMQQSAERNAVGESFMKADIERMREWEDRVEEIRFMWRRVTEDMTFAITDGFAEMLTGLRGFKDAMIGIWQEIRRVIAGILSKMVADFIGGYVRKAVAAMAGAAVAGTTLSAATGSAAAAASGVGGAAAGAGGGVGSLLALATNPFTIAAAGGVALALLVGKKGLFRGGEEATQVSPRRDRLVGQFGPSGTGPGSGFANLSAFVGSPRLFGALMAADTVKEFEAAQSAVIGRLAMRGHTGVKAFNMGGFVPPGTTQLAILHGGAHGEDVVPRGSRSGETVINNYVTVQAMDGASVERVFRNHGFRILNDAALHNVEGYRTGQQKGLGIRPPYGTR